MGLSKTTLNHGHSYVTERFKGGNETLIIKTKPLGLLMEKIRVGNSG